jgi:hypothetical protein
MHAGKLNAELIWPHFRHHWLRPVVGSRVVVTPVAWELTAGKNAAVPAVCV